MMLLSTTARSNRNLSLFLLLKFILLLLQAKQHERTGGQTAAQVNRLPPFAIVIVILGSVFYGKLILNVGGWGGLVQNPTKTPQNPSIAFFDPDFTFRGAKMDKSPGVGGFTLSSS